MLTFAQLGRIGRFANQLFQIAGTIGLARKHGYAYGFPAWKNYDHAERFGSTEDIDLQKYFKNPLPQVDAIGYPDYPVSWGWHDDLHPPDNVSLSGHLQSEKYFSHCKDIIQHYFTMKEEAPDNDDVAIHVRLGDYDDKYHTRLGADYYINAMSLFPQDTPFKVFSDEPKAAAGLLNGHGFVYASEGRNYIEDFKLMKTCKHFITGNSSYSLMAAILGKHPDKKVVCPSNWFGPAWMPETKDLYPQNAIIV